MSAFGLPPISALQNPKKKGPLELEVPGLSTPTNGASTPFSATTKPAMPGQAPLAMPSVGRGAASGTAHPQLPKPVVSTPPAQHVSDPALRALQTQYAPIEHGFNTAQSEFEHAKATRNNLLGVVKPIVAFNPKLDMTPPHWAGTTPGGATALDTAQRQLAASAAKRDTFIPGLQKATAGFRDYTDRSQANAALRAAGGIPTPIPMPSPSTPPAVVHSTVPARSPAQPGSPEGITSVSGGASATAPLPRPIAVNLGAGTDLGGGGVVGNSVASSVKDGVPTYDNASIDRITARNAQPAVAASNTAPLAMSSVQPNLTVPGIDLPSINTSRVSDAEREREGLAKSLDDQLGRMNFQGLDTRGKRDLYASLLRDRAGLSSRGGQLAGSAAAQALAAATQAGTATQGQVGENQRMQLSDANSRDIAAQREQGDMSRAVLDSLTKLSAPSQITDSEGRLVRVTGSNATPVLGPGGKPVLPLQDRLERPDANTLVTAYTAQRKAIEEAAGMTGKAPDYSTLDTSPIGQAYQRALAPLAMPTAPPTPPADHVAKLRANPHWAHYFDQHYGKGAAARYLKGGAQ